MREKPASEQEKERTEPNGRLVLFPSTSYQKRHNHAMRKDAREPRNEKRGETDNENYCTTSPLCPLHISRPLTTPSSSRSLHHTQLRTAPARSRTPAVAPSAAAAGLLLLADRCPWVLDSRSTRTIPAAAGEVVPVVRCRSGTTPRLRFGCWRTGRRSPRGCGTASGW